MLPFWLSLNVDSIATNLVSNQSDPVSNSLVSNSTDELEPIDSEVFNPLPPTGGFLPPSQEVQPSTPTASCSPDPNLATTQLAISSPSGILHTSNWGGVMDKVLPSLTVHFSARPFPEIHQQARLAQVPVMMYHDIIAEKEVFFDVTPEEFAADLQLIQENGLTPISLDQLVEHLSAGVPLPEKPILLTFDDGYAGHYTYVYPLLKQYGYPAAFSIYPYKVGREHGRPGLNWEQVREMAADPLVTIASHSVNHPADLRELPDDQLRLEIFESKEILERELGIPIHHFVYPEGKYDERVAAFVQEAGYHSALTMNDAEDKFAGESESLLAIDRIGQSGLETVITEAYGGAPLINPFTTADFNFSAPVRLSQQTIDEVPLIFASGGKPVTIHANSRYQVAEIMEGTEAVAAVDGGFFSLESLDSNVMVGPVFSQSTNEFVPGNPGEIPLITGRPLVLISPNEVRFVPFDPAKHNTLEGIQAEMPEVTDAFVGAAWLVREGLPQPAEAFGNLFDFDAARDRAYWGIDQAGQPIVGVSGDYVDSITLGQVLAKAGMRDVIMVDSGASASLAYQGESMMSYEPRPVPHVVALLPPVEVATSDCAIVSQKQADE
ncbi:MAG: polysaccharide deacetylase family protein [Cyanobacteria bacterium CRU_2_1]|nr:polysaccharide deacetylase family protein [Cyanobacteria bacterium RU_5_0]NJR62747.1 polysaccharide deacetylase family protein [Cyanobacteria bacterium CRU_2_1]